MGRLNMVRVDYRIVHGQIVVRWIKFHPVDRLAPANDSLVDDPFMDDIYRMVVPNHKADIVKLGGVQTAIGRKNDIALLTFKDVASTYTVYKNGLRLPELNVGAVQNSAQRKAAVQGVALTVEEHEKLSEMKTEGANVLLQPILENDPANLGLTGKKPR